MSDLIHRTARKAHRCSLCHEEIDDGIVYVYQRITPWDHDENETFFDYRAHIECHEQWTEIAHNVEYMLPACKDEWREMLGG